MISSLMPDWNDPALTRTLWRSLAVLAAVTFVTAIFSDLYYFPDEHYQVLEFMSLKLGLTRPADMPWEYGAHIRPWMQPFLYWLIAAPLRAAGLSDMFFITFLLRLITGALSLASLAVFARAVIPTLPGREERFAFARYLPLFGFLPYLFVRTSSETISAAFFTLALALAMQTPSARRLFWSGLLCGLAFDCRYQTSLLIAPLFAWLVFIARARIPALIVFCATILAMMLAGVVVDHWGYGLWQFTPWLYFKANILDNVAGGTFGTMPVFAYLYLLPAQFFALITLLLMAAMFVMAVRAPRHVLSWVAITFFVLNSLVGHKEPRFLFPLAQMATAFPALAFSPHLPRWQAFGARIWSWRNGALAKFTTAVSVLLMAFLAVYPFSFRPHMPMARYVYYHYRNGLTAYAKGEEAFVSYPMYLPPGAQITELGNDDAIAPLLAHGPIYLFTDRPTLPSGLEGQVIYSEFPLEDFGYGAAGTRYLDAFARFSKQAGFLKLPPLGWITLYRVERATTRS
jgi:GPI mannosyltransferase 3